MVANIDEFADTLEQWLDDGGILADTRRFLESGEDSERPGGITDSQRANWRRRGLPGAFVQGAALCYRAQSGTTRPPAAHRGPIEGGPYWQVIVVHAPERVDQEMLDCSILRLWHDLRALDRGSDWFTHIMSRSKGGKPDENPEGVEPLVEDDSFQCVPFGEDVTLVSWDVGREPRDQGYASHLRAAIANDRVEAVGGHPGISVTSGHLLAFLPRSVLDRKLPSNPRGVPTAFSALLFGDNPARLMERYLGIHENPTEKDFRRIASWYEEGPQVGEWLQGAHGVPELIRRHPFFEDAEDRVRKGTHQAFVTHIDDPSPFLSHFMVFGSRRPALNEGVSDG